MKRYVTTRTIMILIVAVSAFISGCEKHVETEFPTIDKLTPGIFIEPEERFVLPAGVEIRKVYEKGIELTKASEGFIPKPYNDPANYCTIGYGHLIHLAPCDPTIPEEFKKGITVPRGTEILRNDMEKAEIGVMMLVDAELTDGQFAALCDFVFNVGIGNFRKSTLRKRVNEGDYDRVPFEFRRWVYAGGKRLPGLETRRENKYRYFLKTLEFQELSRFRIRICPQLTFEPEK